MGTDDKARFGVELEDHVSAPGKRAATQIDLISAKLRKMQRFAALASLGLGKMASVGIARGLAAGIGAVASSMAWVAAGAASAAGGMAALAGTVLTKGVVSMAQFAESTQRGFGFLLHDQAKGKVVFEQVRALANELGLDIKNVGHQMQHMLAMQFKSHEAADLIRLSSDLQAIGSSAEQANRALTALTQIKAKGKLQSEELVGQLAEAGVSTVLVYEALSKQLGKTQDEIKKLLGAGKITADQGIAAIKTAIMHKVGESRPGEAAASFMSSTLTGALQRLQALPNTFFLKIAERMPTQMAKLTRTITMIERQINALDTKPFARFVSFVLDAAQEIVPLVREFAMGFIEGFGELAKGLKGTGLVKADLATARDFGKGLAKVLEWTLVLLQKLARAIGYLTTPQGKMVAGTLAALAGWVKLYGALKLVKEALGPIAALTGKTAGKVVVEKFVGDYGGTPAGLQAFTGEALEGAAGGAAAGAAQGRVARALGWMRAQVTRFGSWLWGAAAAMVQPVIAWFSTAATAIGTTLGGVTLAVAGAIAAAVGSLAYLGYVIYKNWDDIKLSLEWAFGNFATMAKDAGKWIAYNLLGGWLLSAEWNALKRMLGVGEGPEASYGAAAGRVAARGAGAPPPPRLNPETAAAVGGGAKSFVARFGDINITGADTKGDPKKAGQDAGAAAADTMESWFARLHASVGG